MGVGLYTSRLVLEALGVVDYGIYGLVGGIVTLFSFLNSAMSTATQRYLSFDIGKKDWNRLGKTFSASLNIHFFIAFLIFILAETIGLWFVNYHLNLPKDRMPAVNWVYQFSIFTFIWEVIQVPYNALLIAREHMKVYAYISIVEAFLKLLIVYILIKVNTDKLILYAILTFSVSVIIRTIYKSYCKKHFAEAIYNFYYDKTYYRELIQFSGWNLFGNIAVIARGQGSNILLNFFFGPVANAAYGLTSIVQGVLGNFINNFQVAVNPRITKEYAKENLFALENLIRESSKFSFFGMFILVIPILYNAEYILQLWLGTVPAFTVEFVRIALIYTLIETLSNPLMTGAQATGKIKWYQIVIGTTIFLTLPISWVVLKITQIPYHLFWVLVINSAITLFLRILFLRRMIGLNVKRYFNQVILRVLIVTLPITVLISTIPLTKASGVFSLLIQTVGISSIILGAILLLGTNQKERKFFIQILRTVLTRVKNISRI